MYVFETLVSDRQRAERITAAFYRFLDMHAPPEGAAASVHTEMLGARQRCAVTLWSDEARDAFRCFLNRFELPEPPKLEPRFGPVVEEEQSVAWGHAVLIASAESVVLDK